MSSSDDEAPGEESFANGKVAAENVRNLILEKMRKEKQELKMKRQNKLSMFVNQKKEKMARLEKRQQKLEKRAKKEDESNETTLAPIIPSLKDIIADTTPVLDMDTTESSTEKRRNEPRRKFYKDLNIEVKTFNQLKNTRATDAINFKSKRLAKPHRESVLISVIHAEKLKAAGKL